MRIFLILLIFISTVYTIQSIIDQRKEDRKTSSLFVRNNCNIFYVATVLTNLVFVIICFYLLVKVV